MRDATFERRDELLDAALDEFCQMSFEEASLNSIIKAAGISKGTFYYHFENKEQLYLYLLDKAAQAKWAFINTQMQAGPPMGDDIFAALAKQAELGMLFAHAEPRYHMLYSMFLKEKGNPIYDKVRMTLGGENSRALEEMVDRAYDGGYFKEQYSREFVTGIISHMFTSFYDIFTQSTSLEAMQENMQMLLTFMRKGLAE